MQTLLQQVKSFASRQKFFVLHCQDESNCTVRSLQDGVFRVNCVDCLDRTNVAQSAIARHLLVPQAKSVYIAGMQWNKTKSNSLVGPSRLETTSESQFNKIWSNNADILSKQYAGTGALKTDYTRSGKRSTKGLFKDGVNSVMRMYYKNFVDEERQDAMDLWLGVAVINSIFSRTLLWSRYNNVQRLSPGGDKQYVMVELREQGMVLTSPEGIHYEYPRKSFLQWSKRLSTSGKARLRLWFDESVCPESLTIANPLDLHFHKGGPAARERFLRALVSWSDLSIPGYGQRIRVRIFSTSNEAPSSFSEWGIPSYEEHIHPNYSNDIEILCLIVPSPGPNSRKYGLAAVPLDMDTFGYHLVSAIAADRIWGPSMAVFVKGNISKGLIMEVNEHAYRSSMMSKATHVMNSDINNNNNIRLDRTNSHNGGVAIGLEVSGVALCFVGVHVQGPRELFDVLTHLRVGRPDFDITNQFPIFFFYLSGMIHGDLHWSRKNAKGDPIWAKMADGSQVMTFESGTSLMRNSFPNWEYLENLQTHERIPFHNATSSSSPHSLIQPLIDEYIPGRPLPQLTKDIYICDVWISHLAANHLRLPPGTDPGLPLSFYLTFENDWVEDGVTTKIVQRGNQPYWSEAVLVRMLLTQDVADLCDQYLLGRVMIETPFVEDIAAGYFILPLYATGNFDIPIRLGGVYAGCLSGLLQIQKMPMTETMLWDEKNDSNIQSSSQHDVVVGKEFGHFHRQPSTPPSSHHSPHIKRTNKKKNGSDAFDTPQDHFTSHDEWTSSMNHNTDDDLIATSRGISEEYGEEEDDPNRPSSSSSSSDREEQVSDHTNKQQQQQDWFDSSALIELDYEPTESNTRTKSVQRSFDDLLISEPVETNKSSKGKPSVDDLLNC
ncbi:Phosphatidylinositide phosphatase SAC2 [Galdieria sulphuraria]|nr:Phosphatidylinositide phosphatase SAC2 [Galdieria sulphuraria]